MQILSATQAISPAWNHTRDLLLRPRRWQLLLKIGAVAVFAQTGAGGFNGRIPMGGGHNPGLPPAFAGMMLAFTLLFAFFGLLVALVMFYVGSRLQFVLFDVVLRRDTKVGPIWTRFGGVTWPWIGLKLLFYLIMLLCLIPIAAPFVYQFVKLWHAGAFGAHPNFFAILPTILIAVLVLLLYLLFFTACYFLLIDLGLPSIALEATPIRETVRRILALLRLETGQVLLFVLMRFLLGFAGAIAAEIGLVIAALIAFIPFGGIGYGLWLGLHHAGIMGKVFMGLGFGVLGLVYLVLFIIAAIGILGYLYTFLQTYAIYFLAGRYPLMGDMLDRYTPGYLPPPPPSPYPPLDPNPVNP